jgi:hypothetical protein
VYFQDNDYLGVVFENSYEFSVDMIVDWLGVCRVQREVTARAQVLPFGSLVY